MYNCGALFPKNLGQQTTEDYIHKCKHSHKKQKDSLETRVVLIEISVMSKFTECPKKLGSLLKNMTFSEGNQLFTGDFRANPDKASADMVQFTN